MRTLLKTCLLLVITLNVANADTVTIRADEWYPVNGGEKSAQPGYMIEIAKEILMKNGHSLDYQTLPWVGSIAMVRKGTYDCVVGADASDAPDFLFSKNTWGKIKPVMYVKQGDTWRYGGIPSLSNKQLGIIGSYAYSDELDQYIANHKDSHKVQEVKADKALRQNIGKLLSGRIDVLVEFDLIMEAKLAELNFSDKVIAAGDVTQGESLYIACGPNKASSAKYIELFSNGLTKMRENGQLQSILDKYGLQDWE